MKVVRKGIKTPGRKDTQSYAGVNFEEYNAAIRKICKKQKCCLADIASLNIPYETLDGSHPTNSGHVTIAHAWITCLELLGIIGPSAETCEVP